ncbi:MAG: hypothetical protein FJ102_10640 [Deltaproteobacteria bacterium]|nr:hypothetical protein [Deltaproteobacteria bacterium]
MIFLALLGCPATDDTGVSPTEYADCDPISDSLCSLPFPSSFYLREDSSTPTGYRVRLGATTIPATQQGEISYQPAPDLWNELDGFSPMGPLVAEFPGMADANLVGHDNIAASIADGSSTVILDWDTGARVPHWAELDYAGNAVEGNRILFIRPAVPLEHGHRYVVGIRGLVDKAGAPVDASTGFAALRDGTATDDWNIEGRRSLYDDIFSRLEADGWSKGETQLAWDLVIKSADAVALRGEVMRDDARERLGADGPPYTITSVSEFTAEENAYTWKRIYGEMTVPRYTEEDEPGTLLSRDSNGLPEYVGDTTVPFTIIVPRTAQTEPRPLKLLQYGHGLLGSQDEVEGSYLSEIGERYGYVIFATDWTGMKGEDTDAITLMILQDLGRFPMIAERSQQGFLEFHAALWMMKGAMSRDENLTVDGTSLVDTSEVYYYGNSQGAILGGAYVALSHDIERATLGVGGAPYSLLLSRSSDFTPFFGVFQSVYDDERELALWMALLQQVWDPGEAGGYGRLMNESPREGTPAKAVLLQDAVGDAQVTTLGAQNMARAFGAAIVDPALREVYGLEVVTGSHVGSALAEYDHGAPEVPYTNTPPDDNYDTHEDTRRAWAAQEQMAHFFETGEVDHYCEGQCFCADGACDGTSE